MPAFTVNAYPKRWHGFHKTSIMPTGVKTLVYDTAQAHGHYYKQQDTSGGGASINGAYFTQSAFIAAGTYTLAILGETTTGSGILDIYVDNVFQFGAQDWYSAAPSNNVIKTGTITVVGDGYHIIKFLTNSHNISSGDYVQWITHFQIYPSAD